MKCKNFQKKTLITWTLLLSTVIIFMVYFTTGRMIYYIKPTPIKSHRFLNIPITSHFFPSMWAHVSKHWQDSWSGHWLLSNRRSSIAKFELNRVWFLKHVVMHRPTFTVTLRWCSFCICSFPHIPVFVIQLSCTMIAFFHVSWYVCQIHMGELWSSCRVKLASEEEGEGKRKTEGGQEELAAINCP